MSRATPAAQTLREDVAEFARSSLLVVRTAYRIVTPASQALSKVDSVVREAELLVHLEHARVGGANHPSAATRCWLAIGRSPFG